MIATQDYKTIIEKIVTSNKRFSGNEDLLEDFCSEAMEKALFVLKKADEISRIDNYLNKLVSNAMINVLKTSGRLERVSDGYKSIVQKTVSVENPLDNGFLEIKDTSINFLEKMTEQETLQEIYDLAKKFDAENPLEQYGQIFNLKYVENKKQREIAYALGISQGEVSKRLFKLMKKISAAMQ